MTSVLTTAVFLLAKVMVVLSQEEWRYTGDNVALTRPTRQWPGTYLAHETYYAVDGNSDPFLSDCSVTTRVYNTDALWSVDFDKWYILKGIRIYNQNSNRDFLGNFQVIGYPGGVVLHDDRAASRALYNELVIDIPVYTKTAFSYVRVKSPAHTGWPNDGWSQLTLCEVEIYRDNGWTEQLSQNQEVAGHASAALVGVACGAFAGGLGIGLFVMFVVLKCKRRAAKTPTAEEGINCTPQESQPTDNHNYDTLSM